MQVRTSSRRSLRLAAAVALVSLLAVPAAGADELPTSGTHGIAGHVLREDRTPVAGATVRACLVGGTTCRSGVSDATGLYAVTDLPDGAWLLTADPPAGAALGSASRGPIDLTGTHLILQDIVLPAAEPPPTEPPPTTPPPTTPPPTTPPPTTPPPTLPPPDTAPPTTPPTTPAGPTAAPADQAQTDIGVSVTAPFSGRVGGPVTFAVRVVNTGRDAATGVLLRAEAPADASVTSATSSPGGRCDGGAAVECRIGTLASGGVASAAFVVVPAGTGPLTMSFAVEADHDSDPGNNEASASTTVVAALDPPPPPPPPAQPGSFNAVATGTVTVNGVALSPDKVVELHPGDTVDVTDGVITVTTADGSVGSFSSTQFTASRQVASRSAGEQLHAAFTLQQSSVTGGATLTLVGGDFSVCGSRRLAAADQKPVRQLWGSAKGSFETKGRYLAATVRGTVWLTQDRCDGTVATVVTDRVDVTDLSLNKTVSLTAGQSYLALPPRSASSAKRPAQPRASVRWGGRTFTTRAQLEKWLRARGATWRHFARAHPPLAAALRR